MNEDMSFTHLKDYVIKPTNQHSRHVWGQMSTDILNLHDPDSTRLLREFVKTTLGTKATPNIRTNQQNRLWQIRDLFLKLDSHANLLRSTDEPRSWDWSEILRSKSRWLIVKISRCLSELLCARARVGSGCLSIMKLGQYHLVEGSPFICWDCTFTAHPTP